MKAIIKFVDGTSLIVKEHDVLTPILKYESGASKEQPTATYEHTYDGLIPSILDVILLSDYFSVSTNPNAVYNSHFVISVSNED